MKARKVIAIILLILGIAAFGYGGFFYGKEFVSTRNINNFDSSKSYDNQTVAINGGFVSEQGAYDEELLTGCDSAILLRDVKMLQWVNDEKGVRLALANYPVDSFEVDGAKYENPKFYNELPRVVNHGVLKAGNVTIGNSALDAIANSSYVEKTTLENINENGGYKYKLTPYNGSFVTASDDWCIGEVKVDLLEIKDEALENVTIVGKVNDNVLENAKVFDGKLSVSQIQSSILKDYTLYLIIGIVGLVFIIIGIVLLVINKKKLLKEEKEKVKEEENNREEFVQAKAEPVNVQVQESNNTQMVQQEAASQAQPQTTQEVMPQSEPQVNPQVEPQQAPHIDSNVFVATKEDNNQ